MKSSVLSIARNGITILLWGLSLFFFSLIYQETKQVFLGKEIFFSVENVPLNLDKSVKTYFNERERDISFMPISQTSIGFYYKTRELFWQDFPLYLAKKSQSFLTLVFLIFVIWQLKKILGSIAKNETFDMKNIRRIRSIAFAQILISVVSTIINILKTEIIAKNGYKLENTNYDMSLIGNVFFAIVILALA